MQSHLYVVQPPLWCIIKWPKKTLLEGEKVFLMQNVHSCIYVLARKKSSQYQVTFWSCIKATLAENCPICVDVEPCSRDSL